MDEKTKTFVKFVQDELYNMIDLEKGERPDDLPEYFKAWYELCLALTELNENEEKAYEFLMLFVGNKLGEIESNG
ncbi:hypothetical protein ACMZ6Y_00300 [Streptococcus pluranimalium]|uniref:hypothetical protein n=1 Tax=Streptococcus hyovaginalis TaxID=149015 RepID=UPI0014783482|nr:hypothetical protein [Streptococcus hyovaginalis]